MILQEYHLGLVSVGLFIGLNPVVDFLEEGVPRVGVSYVEGLREEFFAFLLGLCGAHEPSYESRVEVHHIRESHAVVQGCLH